MSLTNVDGPVVESLSPPVRRRPSWIAGGVLLVAIAGLLGAYLYSVSTATISVVVAAGDLAPGDVIDRSDLRVVEMGQTGGLRAITSDQQELILGATPLGAIPDGTVLNTDLFVDPSEAIPEGQVLLGVYLEPGEIATPNPSIGSEIILLGSGGEAAASQLGTATVWGVYRDADQGGGDGIWLSFLVDRSIELDVVTVIQAEQLRVGQIRS